MTKFIKYILAFLCLGIVGVNMCKAANLIGCQSGNYSANFGFVLDVQNFNPGGASVLVGEYLGGTDISSLHARAAAASSNNELASNPLTFFTSSISLGTFYDAGISYDNSITTAEGTVGGFLPTATGITGLTFDVENGIDPFSIYNTYPYTVVVNSVTLNTTNGVQYSVDYLGDTFNIWFWDSTGTVQTFDVTNFAVDITATNSSNQVIDICTGLVIPEPSAMLLVGFASVGLVARRRRN
jgi:PEP-CTERM motif